MTRAGSGFPITAVAGGALAALQGVPADSVGLQSSCLQPWAWYGSVPLDAPQGHHATDTLMEAQLFA